MEFARDWFNSVYVTCSGCDQVDYNLQYFYPRHHRPRRTLVNRKGIVNKETKANAVNFA